MSSLTEELNVLEIDTQLKINRQLLKRLEALEERIKVLEKKSQLEGDIE